MWSGRAAMKSPPKAIFGVILTFTLCLAAIIAWFSYHKLMACETHEVVIDQSNPAYSVLRLDTACDGVASSYDVSLELVDKTGEHSTIFKYGDGTSFVKSGDQSKPLVRWVDSRTLQVDIGTVAYVSSAFERVGNVTIRYKIGKIMFKS
jgi:hypothetical protein